jgi:hypothetical protein
MPIVAIIGQYLFVSYRSTFIIRFFFFCFFSGKIGRLLGTKWKGNKTEKEEVVECIAEDNSSNYDILNEFHS